MNALLSSQVGRDPVSQIGVRRQEESGMVKMKRILVQEIKPSLLFYYSRSFYVNSVDTTPRYLLKDRKLSKARGVVGWLVMELGVCSLE